MTPAWVTFPPHSWFYRNQDVLTLVALTLLALLTRLHRIDSPEAFVDGELATRHFRGTFHDVRPPLARLLVALGTVGTHSSTILPIALRTLGAVFGALHSPLAHLTVRTLGYSWLAGVLAGMTVIWETGSVTQSRHALPGSALVFFSIAAVLAWVRFHAGRDRPYSHVWLIATGLFVGCAISTNWSALSLLLLFLIRLAHNSWDMLSAGRTSKSVQLRTHILPQLIILILIPLVVYLSLFVLHFSLFSPTFHTEASRLGRHSLRDRGDLSVIKDVTYGTKVTIRHAGTWGGYLHSRRPIHSTRSGHQSISVHPFADRNNLWTIRPAYPPSENGARVRDGDVVLLEHAGTGRRLWSGSNGRVAGGEGSFAVSAHGARRTRVTASDLWRIEFLPPNSSPSRRRNSTASLRFMRTRFRLRHVRVGCYLLSHRIRLPEWGYEQQEVTCVRGGGNGLTTWAVGKGDWRNVNTTTHSVRKHRRQTFLSTFIKHHILAWDYNTRPHNFSIRPSSLPHDWVLARRGQLLWSKSDNSRLIYLIFNPIVAWLVLLSVAVQFCEQIHEMVVKKRRGKATPPTDPSARSMCFLLTAYIVHLLPYYLIHRKPTVANYLPVLYFGTLLLATTFDRLTRRLSTRARLATFATIVLVTLYAFVLLSPLVYGTPLTHDACERTKWMRTWEFKCARMPLSDNMAVQDQDVNETSSVWGGVATMVAMTEEASQDASVAEFVHAALAAEAMHHRQFEPEVPPPLPSPKVVPDGIDLAVALGDPPAA